MTHFLHTVFLVAGFSAPLAESYLPPSSASTKEDPATTSLEMPSPKDVRVIHDGPGIPILAVVHTAFARLQKSIDKEMRAHAATPTTDAAHILHLPIVTSLPEARIESHPRAPREHESSQFPAFFLIGADRHSLAWLDQHHDALATLNATGFLIQADTTADVEQVTDVARGITVIPMAGDQIARMFDLPAYPVLVTKSTVEQ